MRPTDVESLNDFRWEIKTEFRNQESNYYLGKFSRSHHMVWLQQRLDRGWGIRAYVTIIHSYYNKSHSAKGLAPMVFIIIIIVVFVCVYGLQLLCCQR